jgi:hypothetical protein
MATNGTLKYKLYQDESRQDGQGVAGGLWLAREESGGSDNQSNQINRINQRNRRKFQLHLMGASHSSFFTLRSFLGLEVIIHNKKHLKCCGFHSFVLSLQAN